MGDGRRSVWRVGVQVLLAASVAAATAAEPEPRVDETVLRSHLATLASDAFEGRGTGQRGGEMTVRYLEEQAKAIGLAPIHAGGYRQAVELTGLTAQPAKSSLRLTAGGRPVPLSFGDDWVWRSGAMKPVVPMDAPLLFVGHGIHAPEEGWDDFKGVDCRGKLLVVLADEPAPTAEQPQRFGGRARTVYSLPRQYKHAEALRRGAAGMIEIHREGPGALVPWSVIRSALDGEAFHSRAAFPMPDFYAALTEAAGRRLLAAAGQDLDALRAAVEQPDFRPLSLDARIEGAAHFEVRPVVEFNVAGLVPGTDAALKDELVIHMAHWDHLGKRAGEGDVIYNGALDNAVGSAALLAMAEAAVRAPARRTRMFLWTAAEEPVLLGSLANVAQPLWPLARTAAVINLDGLNVVGRTRDVCAPGAEHSELHAMARQAASALGLKFAEPFPDVSAMHFRMDHYSFVRAGVPSVYIGWGYDFVGDRQGSMSKVRALNTRYHEVTDAYEPGWDLAGGVDMAQFALDLGRLVADAPAMPAWKAGTPFARPRDR